MVGKEKQIKKQSSRKVKTSDALEFIMSDVSHIANTLDRILEAVSDRSTSKIKVDAER